MNISLSNIKFMGNGSYEYTPSNYKSPDLTAPMSFNSEQIAYLNEKNISSDMVYADFLLLDTSTKRALIPTAPSMFTADSGKSFTEVYAGYLNDDPTDNVCHVWMSADGSGSLTPEQSLYLKERYDLANLTWDEYKRYLGDLTTFNVLSAKEYASLVLTKETLSIESWLANEGLLPENSWNKNKIYIPDGVFNLYDYLVKEHEKALLNEKLDKAYNVNLSTFVSSCYEKLIRICDSTEEHTCSVNQIMVRFCRYAPGSGG